MGGCVRWLPRTPLSDACWTIRSVTQWQVWRGLKDHKEDGLEDQWAADDLTLRLMSWRPDSQIQTATSTTWQKSKRSS